MDIAGDLIVVGERKGDVEVMNEGKAYVYDLEGNLLATLVSPDPEIGAQFGYKVLTDGEIVFVDEVEASVDGESKAGKVHIFRLGEPATEQTEPEEEITEITSEPDSENRKGIPGFPLVSVVFSVALVVLYFWLKETSIKFYLPNFFLKFPNPFLTSSRARPNPIFCARSWVVRIDACGIRST